MALYALSLGLPAISETGSPIPADRGYLILATGMLGILFGQFGWFANGFYAAALICLERSRWKAAAIAAALAVILAADSFLLVHTGFPSDSGTNSPAGLRAGFYVWWGSMWVLALGAFLLWRGRRSAEVRFTEVPVVDPIGR